MSVSMIFLFCFDALQLFYVVCIYGFPSHLFALESFLLSDLMVDVY